MSIVSDDPCNVIPVTTCLETGPTSRYTLRAAVGAAGLLCLLRGAAAPWKILIAGNRDWAFERAPTAARREIPDGIFNLQDSGLTIERVRFWGSPWQPFFNNWAFNLERSGADLAAKWALIAEDLQVPITHGPPCGILDDAGWQLVESVPRSAARPASRWRSYPGFAALYSASVPSGVLNRWRMVTCSKPPSLNIAPSRPVT